MCRRLRLVMLMSALSLGLPGMVRAQGMNMPNMGPIMTPGGQMMGATNGAPAQDPALSINDTFVSFIDSAVPRTVFSLRYDGMFGDRQPTRATYLFPGSSGFSLPETRVNSQQATTYLEFGLAPWFSLFTEGGYRWVDPAVNSNTSGASDMCYGMKICTWSDANVIATILLRIYQPTASSATLGTGHWTIEPGLLGAYRISSDFHLEGEVRYWKPLGGGDFAGDILRYGLGLSYGQRNPNGIWYMPVLEGIGWTVLSGKTMVASSADNFVVQDARTPFIANAYLGVRIGYAQNVDFYIGYGHSLTSQYWARDMYRVEVRVSY